ncbi:MAG: TonB-dependent receptor plug domain-containing protein, partial [Flavobacteriales bacterium]
MQLLWAQKTITGIITDETGVPLPGATVIELGTTNGVSSDFDGNYTIEIGEEAALEYSFVGYSSQVIRDIDDDLLNVSLNPSNELDEVIVVAYGVQSKESIVGSIAVISDATIQAQQATTITQALQGSIPGVNIITSGGVPGTNPIIRIRGIGSINADSSPLIIVDGAPFNGNLNNIAQEQVESISVLKDASSTSLYGSRGANGVIIITTKSGTKRSKTQLTISSNYGVSNNASALHNLINIDDFTKYAWESSRNSEQYVQGLTPSAAGSKASLNLISELKYNPYGLSQPVNASGELMVSPMWNTDWKKAVFSDNVTRKEHGVSINGGGEKTSFYFGSNYLKEEGQVKTTFFERIATRLKIDTEVNDFIKAGLNVSYTTSKLNAPSQSGDGIQGAIQWLYSVPNYYPLYQRDGNGGLILNSAGERIFDYGNNLT